MKHKKLVPSEYLKEQLKKSEEDIKEGRYESFDTAEELLASLDKDSDAE